MTLIFIRGRLFENRINYTQINYCTFFLYFKITRRKHFLFRCALKGVLILFFYYLLHFLRS